MSVTKGGNVKTASKSVVANRDILALAIEDGFDLVAGFEPRKDHIYTVTRAISARVNQNYDGFPSAELKKSYITFLGKPVFVNHLNDDPTKARGRVVGARYVENGTDKYIEVIQEVNAKKFPKLAKELVESGLDSVSMGCSAERTICSFCHNVATGMFDMCTHVLNSKGKTLRRQGANGQMEDVLVYEECLDLGFFELSYVFDPADETAVVSNLVMASRKNIEAVQKTGFLSSGNRVYCDLPGCNNWAIYNSDRYNEQWIGGGGEMRPHDYCCKEHMAQYETKFPAWKTEAAVQNPIKFHALQLQAYGEIEAPEAIDTLRDDSDEEEEEFHRYVDPPPGLANPDLDKARELDRRDEMGEGYEDMSNFLQDEVAEGNPLDEELLDDPNAVDAMGDQLDPEAEVDPLTGEPVEPEVDPLTGEPVEPEMDPITGQPVVEPEAEIDPETGLPVDAGEPEVDPITGEPVEPSVGDQFADTVLDEYEKQQAQDVDPDMVDPVTGEPVQPEPEPEMVDPVTGLPVQSEDEVMPLDTDDPENPFEDDEKSVVPVEEADDTEDADALAVEDPDMVDPGDPKPPAAGPPAAPEKKAPPAAPKKAPEGPAKTPGKSPPVKQPETNEVAPKPPKPDEVTPPAPEKDSKPNDQPATKDSPDKKPPASDKDTEDDDPDMKDPGDADSGDSAESSEKVDDSDELAGLAEQLGISDDELLQLDPEDLIQLLDADGSEASDNKEKKMPTSAQNKEAFGGLKPITPAIQRFLDEYNYAVTDEDLDDWNIEADLSDEDYEEIRDYLEAEPGTYANKKTARKGNTMSRDSLAERGRVASRTRVAEDKSRNDQGEMEETFLTQTPPAEPVETAQGEDISNTEENLVAGIRARQKALAKVRARKAAQTKQADGGFLGDGASEGETAETIDPPLSGTDDQELKGDLEPADPNEGVVETQPKDASRRAQARRARIAARRKQDFASWVNRTSGKKVNQAKSVGELRTWVSGYSKEAKINPEVMYPLVKSVVIALRKRADDEGVSGKQANDIPDFIQEKIDAKDDDSDDNSKESRRKTRSRRNMTADEKLDVAAPDGRVDVERPTADDTSEEAQESMDKRREDFGDNASDDKADPDLSTNQNWAPGQGKSSSWKQASGVNAVRLARAYITAGIEQEDQEWILASQFEKMSAAVVNDRLALLTRVNEARPQRVQTARKTAGNRGVRPASLPQNLSQTPVPQQRVAAADDSSTDSDLFL